MSKKSKATLQITLRNNDRVKISYSDRSGSTTCYVKNWGEVDRYLEKVMPIAENRRRAEARKQGDGHIAKIKKALQGDISFSELERKRQTRPTEYGQVPHIQLLKGRSFAIQDREMLQTLQSNLGASPQQQHQLQAKLHAGSNSGEPTVIRIGTPVEPSVCEACSMCLSALLAVPRSLWTLALSLVKGLVSLSSCRAKAQR